ncbi:MAG: division/cell wall cluster transcriptional repressor MraZ [Acidimicrobiales bacterium]
MFVGTFEHSLDDKGRVVLPTAFRSRLSDGGYLGPYENCLALWTPDQFQEFVARLEEKVRSREADHNALRALSARVADVRPDAQGRIVVPPKLRSYAGLVDQAVITGALNHIELWSPGRWDEISSQGDASLADAIATLGIH